MDTNPLPNQDSDHSDSGSLSSDSGVVHYVARITSCEKFDKQVLLDFLNSEYQFTRYVVGEETVPQQHFHIVITTDESVKLQDVRDIIRAFLIPFWETEDHRLPKGFGNKQYNLQVSTDVEKAIIYAVKCKNVDYAGWSDEYIEACQAQSFEKKKPSNFKSEYTQLVVSFQNSDMDIRDFMVKFVELKAKYGQQVVMHHAYGYALSNLILREPDKAEGLVEDFLYKQ